MNILIVDGNEKEASDRYKEIGMDTQYEVYSKVIKSLSNNKFNITTVHPAFKNQYLPHGVSLDDFDGIVWTGSLLNIYDMSPSIVSQIELAKTLFKMKNILLTPHNAALTIECRKRMSVETCETIINYLKKNKKLNYNNIVNKDKIGII